MCGFDEGGRGKREGGGKRKEGGREVRSKSVGRSRWEEEERVADKKKR